MRTVLEACSEDVQKLQGIGEFFHASPPLMRLLHSLISVPFCEIFVCILSRHREDITTTVSFIEL